MSIGYNIKTLRESHGLTQAQFGLIAGVSDKAVSTWESGLRKPRMDSVKKLAQYFDVSESEILFGDGDNLHRLPGGWGCSSYLVDTLLKDPPSPDVIAPLLTYYSEHNTTKSLPLQRLAQALDQLNDEGRAKLVDYADDLVSSGRYQLPQDSK